MGLHSDWKKIKAKGKKLPSNYFNLGFGAACDEYEKAEKAYVGTKDVDKEKKLWDKAKEKAKKVTDTLSDYILKLKQTSEGDNQEQKESADAVMNAMVGFTNKVNGLKKKYKY